MRSQESKRKQKGLPEPSRSMDHLEQDGRRQLHKQQGLGRPEAQRFCPAGPEALNRGDR